MTVTLVEYPLPNSVRISCDYVTITSVVEENVKYISRRQECQYIVITSGAEEKPPPKFKFVYF